AVGWRLRDRVGADSGVGAGLVLDDDRLLPALGQPLGHVARQRVGGAAGRERDDQPHYMVGESLRLRRCRCGTEQAGRQGQHGRRPYVHDWLERSHAGFLFWRGGYPAHWPRLVISTTPRSASTLTQSPVAMHSSGSRSKSVIDGAWLTTAPSAILVVISLNRKAAGATFIRRARWNAADQPEEPLAPGNTSTLPAKLWPRNSCRVSTIVPVRESMPPQPEMRSRVTSASPSATPGTTLRPWMTMTLSMPATHCCVADSLMRNLRSNVRCRPHRCIAPWCRTRPARPGWPAGSGPAWPNRAPRSGCLWERHGSWPSNCRSSGCRPRPR